MSRRKKQEGKTEFTYSIFKSCASEWVIEILSVMSPISSFYLDSDCVVLARIVQEMQGFNQG